MFYFNLVTVSCLDHPLSEDQSSSCNAETGTPTLPVAVTAGYNGSDEGCLTFQGSTLSSPPCLLVCQTPVLPPTITDQIRLWELERDRLQFSEGELFF